MLKLKYIVLLLITVFTVNAQDNYDKSSSFEGLHFYIGYIENEFYTIDPTRDKELKIFIATKEDSNIEINIPNGGSEFVSLPADSVMVMEIPAFIESTESEEITNKLVEIKSDAPVTVYAFSSQPRTSDSYSAIPIANWGKEYYVMSFPNDQYTLSKPPAHKQDSIRLLTPRLSEFLVVSAYDNTKVNITPKALTVGAMQVDETYEITLNKGECYMVQSYPYPAHRGDLSGTKVTSDKPIGVISGHQRASVPIGLNPQFDTKDHLVEMITPAESWGKSYISVPFNISPEGDLFRVMGKESGTIISKKNASNEFQYNLSDDIFMYEFRGVTEPTIWNANKPVQIAQFMMRTNNESRNDLYDPSMVMLSPAEQFVSRVIFHTPGNVFNNPEQYIQHWVTVIAEEEALDNITLNDKLLDTITNISNNRIASSQYYWTRIQLPRGTHKLEAKQGRFSGVLFGNGKYDSYGMILGASLTNPEYEDSLAPVVDYNVDCFEINATAKDDNNISASGIYYAFVKENDTYNYDYQIEPINPNDSIISFTAIPQDIYQDAQIVIEIYDKSGNVKKFSYKHNAVSLDVPDSFEFNAIDWQDSVCFDYTITNTGIGDIELQNIILNTDSRVTLYSDNLPNVLGNNEAHNFKLCINPQGDSTLISGDLDIIFECGIEFSNPVNVGFSAPDLVTEDYDFGNVLVGEDSCKTIPIVNSGNEPITVVSIDEAGNFNQFSYDTSVFPQIILPSDTFFIEICFTPGQLGDFELTFNYENDFNLQKQSIFKGTGIAPNVDDIVIDLGDIRVGDTKDSTLNILNDGNAEVSLFFNQFINKQADDNISQMLENINDVNIGINEEHSVDFSFIPQNAQLYSQIAEYTTNWDNHSDITIEIKANGTIPVIDITDVNFGDVIVYDDTTNNFTIINSNGNEALYIQDAYIIEGDTEYFDFDLSLLENLTINEGGDFELPVSFNPQELGYFEVKIGINNDSYANYNIETDTLIISGNSVPLFSPDLSFDETHEDFYYCQSGTIEVTVTNEESLPVDITNIDLTDNTGNSSITSELPQFPYKLESGESFNVQISSVAERPEIINMSLNIETYNTDVTSFDIEIIPEEKELILNDIDDITVTPGDTIAVSFSGRIPDDTDIQDTLQFEINVPSNYWHLVDEQYFMNIYSTLSHQHQLNVTQNHQKIIVKTNRKFISEPGNWDFTIKILPLLEKNEKIDISVNAYYNKCYINTSKNFISIIDEVCAFDLRITEINSNFTMVKISPNPVSDILNFDVVVKENQKFDISLFDMSGRNIKLGNGIDVKTGKNNFKYPLDNLSNGLYILSLKNEKLNKNFIIVVNK